MSIKHLFYALAVSGMLSGAVSCADDEPETEVVPVDFTLRLNMPISLTDPKLTSVDCAFTRVETGDEVRITEFTEAETGAYEVVATLEEGTYNIAVSGQIAYTLDGNTAERDIEASREGVAVSAASDVLTIETTVAAMKSDDFVIEEIFYTGTETPEGMPYYGDQYMKITNNSDRTLYADGLVIFKSAFMTVEKYDYTPDIMSDYFSVDSGLILPGSGTDYPVAPGASVVIADTAIDHTEFNSLSLDLSGATFEYFNTLDDEDMDNPDVPNVTTLFADDFWTWHNRGFYTYAIGRLGEGVTAESFASDYAYTVEYEMVVPDYGTFPMSDDYWKVPNSWIIDAVNLSIEESFAWIVTSPLLDAGWTYCGKIDGDVTRFGKSVRRKSVSTTSSPYYMDTNDSTADFIPETAPSLKN